MQLNARKYEKCCNILEEKRGRGGGGNTVNAVQVCIQDKEKINAYRVITILWK